MSRLSRLLNLAVIGLLSTTLVIAQQAHERTVMKVNAPNEPVKITKFKLKGTPRGFGQNFTDDDDWLRGMTVNIQNTSNKPIVYLEISLDFPRPENQSSEQPPPFQSSLRYGSYAVMNSPLPPDAPALLMPNERAELKLTDQDYDSLIATLKQLDYPASLKKIELTISTVIFNDDTGWRLGTPIRRDPTKPDRWRNAERDESGAASGMSLFRQLNLARADTAFVPIGFRVERALLPLPAIASRGRINRMDRIGRRKGKLFIWE